LNRSRLVEELLSLLRVLPRLVNQRARNPERLLTLHQADDQ
jgi:hypothetical protein